MKQFTKWVAALALGALAGFATAQNLVTNGGFESPSIGGGNFTVVSSMPGWALTVGTGFEIQSNVAGSPFEGSQHIELDGNVNSGMQQIVPTNAGRSYVLSVEYSPRPGYDASTNGVEVRINGGVVATLAADGTSLSNTAWTKHSFAFVASGPTTVEFRGVGTSDGVGSYIDDVQVLQQAAAPVPALSSTASWALVLLLAFAGAAFVRRARTAR